MNIFVCVKQVPDTETKIQIAENQDGIKTDSIKWIVNPYDEYAIEESLKLKQSMGAQKVYAVSMGPQKRLLDSVRVALAMGCDEGIVIDSEESLDSMATARAVAKAVEKTGEPAVILTGKSAIDDNSQSFSQQLAACLNAPHVTSVTKVTYENESLEVEREAEGGTKETYVVKGLCVLGATKGLNSPRYPSLPGIMKAKKKPVQNLSLTDLESDTKVKVKFVDYQPPTPQPPTQILDGDVNAQVDKLVDLLKNEAKVL